MSKSSGPKPENLIVKMFLDGLLEQTQAVAHSLQNGSRAFSKEEMSAEQAEVLRLALQAGEQLARNLEQINAVKDVAVVSKRKDKAKKPSNKVEKDKPSDRPQAGIVAAKKKAFNNTAKPSEKAVVSDWESGDEDAEHNKSKDPKAVKLIHGISDFSERRKSIFNQFPGPVASAEPAQEPKVSNSKKAAPTGEGRSRSSTQVDAPKKPAPTKAPADKAKKVKAKREAPVSDKPAASPVDLLAAIRAGTKLKHTETVVKGVDVGGRAITTAKTTKSAKSDKLAKAAKPAKPSQSVKSSVKQKQKKF